MKGAATNCISRSYSSSLFESITCSVERTWAGDPGSLFSFFLTLPIDERIPLLQYSRTLRNKGAPRAGFTRGDLCHAERFGALLWTRPSAFPHVQLLSPIVTAQHGASAQCIHQGSEENS